MWAGGTTALASDSAVVPAPGGIPMIPAPAGALGATSSPTPPTISLNWSGYAATSSSKFTFVHSEFVQPAITCPGVKDQMTSNWVGLDGFADQTVEQDGTFAFCGGPSSTTPIYKAWYEMFPANSVNVFAVHPGDVIDATVDYSAGEFTLTIADISTGKSSSTQATCGTCKRASAEWIIERPAECNAKETKCFLFALADFGTTTMSEDVAATDGAAATGASSFTNYPIYMVGPANPGFISLDTVGAFKNATDSFTATWDRSGTTTPIKI